jgi:hypothetical protein
MDLIKKLPAVFQTVTEKKFFDATFDQVFSKKDSEYLSGYVGRRTPGRYNPITDFYLPEPNKDRTWWQLEATAFARNADTSRSNIYFYEDLLNRIEYYGGNILNQDRLFESEYYSFGPPIDYDMFINYQNYYWVEQGLPQISISGVQSADIIGQSSYTTPTTAVPPNFTLSTGMQISLTDDPLYLAPHTVENFGGCTGINLIPDTSSASLGTIFEFLPWDSSTETVTGRVIQNSFWDNQPWEVQTQPINGDYITIERGAQDGNAWSRGNKWYHIQTINSTLAVTGTQFPANATRALRHIIQFSANLELFNSGTTFRSDISYGFGNDDVGAAIQLSDLSGDTLTSINNDYNIELRDGQLVAFFFDADISVRDKIWITNVGAADIVTFTQELLIVDGDIVLTLAASPGILRGQNWYYDSGQWQVVYNEKTAVNQPPLFQLYDHANVKLDDAVKYPGSTFLGSKIFSYKINTTPGAQADAVLRFPIEFKSLGQASDIVFQNNLMTDRYTSTIQRTPIDGYYYYKFLTAQLLYNSWNLYGVCDQASPAP